ncbi:MAG: DUF3422 domain-containing protein [Alphaproteobacteria bacterium]|nr:DUF3422 domain-containing protein [Alphaproteobacteria bacterium]
MSILPDHPDRYALANELHARPFPEVDAPCQAIYFATSRDGDAAKSRAHLLDLLDRFGADHPAPGASHYYGALGRNLLKWELHSEFVSYTLFVDQGKGQPFSGDLMTAFPADWLAAIDGQVITSAEVWINREKTAEDVENRLQGDIKNWFVGESLAAAYMLDRNTAVVGDFRIDEAGHMRFVVIGIGAVGARRMGRVVQRILEIETYKSMAMMTLPVARKAAAEAAVLDAELTRVARQMTDEKAKPDQTLDRLLAVSAKVELLASEASFRFSAGRAYRAIVDQRIKVLREDRILQRQLFSEFMMRRFDPAMRTCEAAEKRLDDLSEHAARAADLLSTRVSVAASEQNRQLLESMNKRAALQMRLQETVEGLSVVAVSYYAVNLLVYLLGPMLKPVGLDKALLAGLLVLPVMGAVWLLVRRIKARVGKG